MTVDGKLEVKDAGYRVWYDAATTTVFFEGSLRLNSADFKPISELLNAVIASGPARITLHMRSLRFLNSSGINTLYKFAIGLRKKGAVPVTVKAAADIGWQTKSLPNLKKFLPTTTIETE